MVAAPRVSDPISVVLLNMGGPDSLDAVEPFLFNLFRDHDLIPLPLGFLWQRAFAKMVSRRRARTVRDYYRLIGGRSPLGEITRAQAEALERQLNAHSPLTGPSAPPSSGGGPRRFRCHVAMRYSPPFTDEAVREVAQAGARTVVALSLYPHYTTATTGSSLWELRRALAGKPPAAGAVRYVEIDRWADDPTYLDALAAQVKRGLERFPEESRAGVELLFSAHGLPETFVHKGDPYVKDLESTIAGVLARLGGQRPWRLAFQSRAGKARWLEPSTDEVLRLLAKTGRRDVLAIPISFVSDHIETLYEIDLLFGDEAKKLGLKFERAPSLNTEPAFISALAGLVERKLAALEEGQP
jgi:ferrochelatase